MDDHDNIIEQREALLDGVNFICNKLERVHDKKRSNFFLIAFDRILLFISKILLFVFNFFLLLNSKVFNLKL